MKELTPKEVFEAIADGKKLECRHKGNDGWFEFVPLYTGVTIENIFRKDYVFRPYQEMVSIGDISLPKGVSDPLEPGTEYWIAEPTYEYYSTSNPHLWFDDSQDNLYLKRGLVHLNRENAIEHSKALIKLSGGIVDD